MKLHLIIALMAATGLAACGGAAVTPPAVDPAPEPEPVVTPAPDPTPEEPEPEAPAPTSAQMISDKDALIDDYSPTTYTTLSVVQTTGAVTYDGYLSGDLSNTSDAVTDEVIGEMSLTVTFNNDAIVVTGDAYNFRDEDDVAMDGTLRLGSATFDRNGDPDVDATFTMTANGTLEDAQGNNLVFGTQLEGDFLGSNYDAIGGDALGRVTHNGTNQDFDGQFIAER